MTLPADAIGCSPGSTFAADNPGMVMSLAEAFNSPAMRATRLAMLAGEPVPACRTCYERERLSGDSCRLQMTRQEHPPPSIADCRERTAADGTVDGFPSFLDLRLGNHCNLRCVMCDIPISSSLVQRSSQTWLRRSLDPYTSDDTFWQSIQDNLGSMRSLYFAGGEPLLLRAHRRLLDLIVDRGQAGRIDLTYATNLTVLPEAILTLWRAFRAVSLEASCDGVGPVFERIREGGRWADFERNADLARQHVQVSINTTTQTGNVLDLGNIIDWALGRGLYITVSNIVMEPARLSVRNLPAADKERARRYLTGLADRMARRGHDGIAGDVRGVLRYLLAPPVDVPEPGPVALPDPVLRHPQA